MKFLIADDNVDNIDMLKSLLYKQHNVTSVFNGKEALEKLRSEKFDFIISDILMPVMDGFSLCIECKKDDKLHTIPFVFYTATYTDAKDEAFALSLGAQKFIRKPCEPVILLGMINEIIKESSNVTYSPEKIVSQEEPEIYKTYNERLVNKLEKKIIELQKEIVERKRIETELNVAKEKAEESNRLKTAFLQNMSHEIRTPLNAIIGFSRLLNAPDLSTAKRTDFTSIIQNSSNQLLSIVTDILAISYLETKQEKLYIKEVCINSILTDLLTKFKNQTKEISISLAAKNQVTDKQSTIFTDEIKIIQILTYLLSNALKFTREGFIEFGYNLKPDSEPHEMEFYVKDSGIGIKQELQESIFEHFNQADLSLSKNYGGTGLGLSISKGFVELMGGKIWVQSEHQKGAIFYFTIPYKPVS